MAFLTGAFSTLAVVVAVSALPKIFDYFSKSNDVQYNSEGEKFIDISPAFFWICYPIGASFFGIGLGVFLFTDEPIAGLGFIGLSLILTIPVFIIHFVDTSVTWTDEYIRGAKSGMSLKKNTIDWQDISEAKYLANHTMELRDKFGKKVCWSIYQRGWRQIIGDLRRLRPDIDSNGFD